MFNFPVRRVPHLLPTQYLSANCQNCYPGSWLNTLIGMLFFWLVFYLHSWEISLRSRISIRSKISLASESNIRCKAMFYILIKLGVFQIWKMENFSTIQESRDSHKNDLMKKEYKCNFKAFQKCYCICLISRSEGPIPLINFHKNNYYLEKCYSS